MSKTFVSHEDAKRWAIDVERQINRGQTPTKSRIAQLRTLGHLIDLHIADMKAVGRAPGRTKTATPAMLKRELGSRNIVELDRERLLQFDRQRAEQGAGPVTLSTDIGPIKLVISHAAAVHGLPVRAARRGRITRSIRVPIFRQAERHLAADIGIATADLYPSINLGASAGIGSASRARRSARSSRRAET